MKITSTQTYKSDTYKNKIKQKTQSKLKPKPNSRFLFGGNPNANSNDSSSTNSKKDDSKSSGGFFSTIWGYVIKLINFIAEKIKMMDKMPEFIRYMSRVVNNFFYSYGGYIAFIIYVALVGWVFFTNPYEIVSKYQGIVIGVSLLGGFLIMMIANFTYARREFGYRERENEESKKDNLDKDGNETKFPTVRKWLLKIMGIITVIGAFCAVLTGILLLLSHFDTFLKYVTKFSFYIAIFVGAAIVIKLLSPYTKNIANKIGEFGKLIWALIVYIPCLIIDITENIVGTKKAIWVLLAVEFLILSAYLGIPLLMKSNLLKYGIVLASDAQNLNAPVKFDQDKLEKIIENSPKKMQYAFSADIWIEPQPTSTSLAYNQDTKIISFGDRIKIEYNGRTPDVLIVKALEGKEIVEVARPKIYLQRWNKIVVNYDHGVVDLFVNGELIRSQQNVPYMMAASLSAGSGNGIYGGIKDVRMFDEPLSKNMIDYI